MIVQCAACQARFKIADDKVTDRGVKVRCRKCSTVFVVRKEAAPAPDAPPSGRVDTGPRPRPGTPPAAVPPVRPTAAAPRPAPAAGADPFRRFQTSELGRGDPFQRPGPPAPAAPAMADPFAGLNTPQAPPPPPPASDPFASLDLGSRPAPPTPPSSDDPFANIDIGALPGPAAAVASTPRPAANEDPFANMDLGGGPPPPASQDPFAGLSAQAPAPSSADPFAGLDLGGPAAAPTVPARTPSGSPGDPFAALAPAAAPRVPTAAPRQPSLRPAAPPPAPAPAAPPSLDLGAVELGSPDPLGMGLPEEPLPPPPGPGGLPSFIPPGEEAEPKTVVRSISWSGGDADKVEVHSPAALYAAQLMKKQQRPQRSLAASFLLALLLLGVGGLVLERSARALRAPRGAAAQAPLAVADLASGIYPTRGGRSVFFVHGTVTNGTGAVASPAVKVTVELRSGAVVQRTAEAWVGRSATVEDLYLLSGPLEFATVAHRLASLADPLAAGAKGEFLAVFPEYPDGVTSLDVVAVAAASKPPAMAAGPQPPASAAPDPAAAGADVPAAKREEPAAARPVEKPSPSPKASRQPKPKLPDFPMDEPKRPLKVQSGAPAPTP